MAKRKPARPASRARTPGAARAVKGGRAKTRQTASTKAARGGRRPAAGAKKRAPTRAASAAARKKAAARTTRPTGRPASAKAESPAPRPRTLVTRRSPAQSRRGAGESPKAPLRREAGAGPGSRRRQIERDRRLLEEEVPTPPSSLDLDRRPSAARSGRAEMEEALHEHTASDPALTAGDVDADWESAYNTGDEAPGGDMPTPDQAVVEEIGTAIGVEYADNEELKGVNKIEERDRHRWELDPASSEDYQDRARPPKKR